MPLHPGVPLANAGFRTIAYDRRGFGRSSQPWNGYNYDTLSDDLEDVLSTLQLSDVTLIGFSMGGGEVARFLTRHGKSQVRSATLISSIIPYMQKTETNPHGIGQESFDQMRKSLSEDRAHFSATLPDRVSLCASLTTVQEISASGFSFCFGTSASGGISTSPGRGAAGVWSSMS